eukprot:gene11256-13099_t
MDVFLELPFELSRILIVDWCTVRDLLALDSAYCNKTKREAWGEVLRSTDHFYEYKLPFGKTLAAYQTWIFTRLIPTRNLVWNINTSFALCGAYLKELGNSIQDAVIHYKKDDRDIRHILTLIESRCGTIESLTCDSCALDPVLSNLLHKPSLKHLKIQDCMDLPTEFDAISNREGSHHIQLHSLDLSSPKSQSLVQLLLKLVDPFPIRQLQILACNDVCMGYNEKLDGLTTLIISAAGRYTPVWADGHCAKLKRLRLVFSDISLLEFDFTRMTVQVLPRLQTLAVCCEDVEEEEPKKLQELRVARPNLRVYFNTDVLTYDLMKLPL